MSLRLPDASEVVLTLKMAIGEKPPLRQGPPAMDLEKPDRRAFISFLRNDGGGVRGAILVDLNAAVFLGGVMIMMPPAGLEEQVGSGDVSEPILDAMAEINNMLRGVINNCGSNEHVTPDGLQPYSPPEPDGRNAWLLSPAVRLDLTGEFPFGSGTMVILSA